MLDEHETVVDEIFDEVVVVVDAVVAARLAWLAAEVTSRMKCIPMKVSVFIMAILLSESDKNSVVTRRMLRESRG